jgi:hypothetical protein
LHPVGEQPHSVYWWRRAVFLAVVALAFLTMYAVFGRGGGGGGKSHVVASTSQRPSTTVPPTSSAAVSTPATTTAAPSTTAPARPVACVASQLTIAAAADAKSYPVGAKPKLSLLVTNRGPLPCIDDLADSKIELRVLSGGARVWGSHDCAVAPGTSPQTLPVGMVVRRTVEWSGLSSQPGCAGERQVVPAGTYSVTALLAGQAGPPVSFTFN